MTVTKTYCDICKREISDKYYFPISICRKKYNDEITDDFHEWEACEDCCSKIEKLIYETVMRSVEQKDNIPK